MNKNKQRKIQTGLNLDMMHAIETGNEVALQQALEQGANPRIDNSKSLAIAAKLGFSKILERLIPLCDPQATHSYALYLAIIHSHPECIKVLLPVSHQDKDMWETAWEAVLRQNEDDLDVFKLVIESPLFKHAPALEALNDSRQTQRFIFFETLLAQISDADLKANPQGFMSDTDMLIETLKSYRFDFDGESRSDDRYLELFFDRIKSYVQTSQMESVLSTLNLSKGELEAQSIQVDLAYILKAKWEQWQLQLSTPASAYLEETSTSDDLNSPSSKKRLSL